MEDTGDCTLRNLAKTTGVPSEPSGRGLEQIRSVELPPRQKDKLAGTKYLTNTPQPREPQDWHG
jgi:hypothetical protein